MSIPTVVSYNDVTLYNVRTLAFEETVRRDESGTDILYHQFRIRVEGICHANITGGGGALAVVEAGQPDALATARAIHARLMTDRRPFSYAIGGNVLLEAYGQGDNASRDVNNGPKPVSCNITHVCADKVLRIEFEIEICLVKCGSMGTTGTLTPVLNNRWSVEDTYDENQYLTRTVEGVLVVSRIEISPRSLLPNVIPPLAKGFRRARVRGLVSPDGLTLRYTTVDVQQYAAPPSPATSWEASYTESTNDAGGSSFAEVTVRMEGPPTAPKNLMLARCAQVVEARLGSVRQQWKAESTEKKFYVVSAAVIEIMNKNQVELRVRVRRIPKDQSFLMNQINLMGKFLEEPTEGGVQVPNYDHTHYPAPDLTTSPIGRFAMILQSPCNDYHGLTVQGENPINPTYSPGGTTPPPSAGNSGRTGGTPPPPIVDFRTAPTEAQPDISPPSSVFSASHLDAFYQHYTIDNHYRTQTGRVMLPVATNSDAANTKTAVFPRMHKPVTQRVMKLIAERVGKPPELPKATEELTDPNQIKEYLLESNVVPSSPAIMADGASYLYRVDVQYTYGLERNPTDAEKLRAGAGRMDNMTPVQASLDLSKVMIDPSQIV